MVKKPFDLKNDPRFKARVAKLEGNQHVKVIKDPVKVTLADGFTVYVACIGINDAYLVVQPSEPNVGIVFSVYWTKSDNYTKAGPVHDAISKVMLNWLMLASEDTDFEKRKHGSYDILSLGMETMVRKEGASWFEQFGQEFSAVVQGTLRDNIKNPYHR